VPFGLDSESGLKRKRLKLMENSHQRIGQYIGGNLGPIQQQREYFIDKWLPGNCSGCQGRVFMLLALNIKVKGAKIKVKGCFHLLYLYCSECERVRPCCHGYYVVV
jgi:hypothetical protein